VRIVVCGTHASGKSTLVADFAARHPRFAVLSDPFGLLDEAWDAPGPALFTAQLKVSAARLHPDETASPFIAERGPIDFLAYLLAWEELTGAEVPRDLLERLIEETRDAMARVDVLVVLPLTPADEIFVHAEEDLALREAMNDILLDLVADDGVTGGHSDVVEITGDRDRRLAALEAVVANSAR
jgi:hypothetical protein